MNKESIALLPQNAHAPIICKCSGNMILLSLGQWPKEFPFNSTTVEGR